MKTTTLVKLIGVSMILEMSSLLTGCAISVTPVPTPTPTPTPAPTPVTIVPAPLPGVTANPTPTTITILPAPVDPAKLAKKQKQLAELQAQIQTLTQQIQAHPGTPVTLVVNLKKKQQRMLEEIGLFAAPNRVNK